MKQNVQTRGLRTGFARLAVLLLAVLVLFAAFPSRPAQAAEWMQPYLDRVQEWGIMRGDANGNLHEDRTINRAEFVTLVNRAFGYTEAGENSFGDVDPNDWFAEDIAIAYKAGYFSGTSDSTASPLNPVSREQAAVLLGRCLRLQGVPGAANSTFTDMQEIGGWSRGLIQECADLGIIQGYADGTFRPKEFITRGQMACFLVRALGTLVQEPGEQAAGGVYGNLTITTPGVKLKDTTVTGNLYLTGGVGLGNVELENVDVLGKIIICGTGEAERGDHSVILRNVTAPELEIDSLTNQFISLQSEGLTDIGSATVRSSAFLQDLTEDGLGFQKILLNGTVEDLKLQLAGNIKDVTNLSPASTLQLAQGTATTVTIDERAVDSILTIDDKASIKTLNLDHGTPVNGLGSISHLNINAPGSIVDMLPDTVTVRPGITGNVNKQEMNNIAAAESSDDPRLLAGYPLARNIAPTSADAVFRTNKTGTIRWAITALMDGSVGEEELVNPGNTAKIIRSGTINATASNTDFTARLTGLTKSGSYYISALLEDARGRRSPVKVTSFTTTDDTAPNFASGYPQAPVLTRDADGEQIAQIMVMATKGCQMYYALFPVGSTAPTAADFRAGALSGNLGSGVVTLQKNVPFLVSRINTSYLQEKTNYDLYLWLSDADNGKSSSVRKITITTKDFTAPNLLRLEQRTAAARTVTMSFALDEPGTLSWVVVKKDRPFFKGIADKSNPGVQGQIQIENAIVSGNVVSKGGPVRAAREDTDYNFTVNGLEEQTAYDLYYSFKDTAGNYGVYSKAIDHPYEIRTQDGLAPTVELSYSHSTEDTNQPWADSDISLDFSEVVLGSDNVADVNFFRLYQDVVGSSGDQQDRNKRLLADALQNYIAFYPGNPPSGDTVQGSKVQVVDENSNLTQEELEELPAWIDYREAVVTQEDQKTTITFPNGKAIQLQSGSPYFFAFSTRMPKLEAVKDSSGNEMKNTYKGFRTTYAIVNLAQLEDERAATFIDENGDEVTKDAVMFSMEPVGTEGVARNTRWDMLIWTKSNMRYDLLVRANDSSPWTLLGRVTPNPGGSTPRVFNSLNGNFKEEMIATGLIGSIPTALDSPYLPDFPAHMEFAIVPVESSYNSEVVLDIQVYAGTNSAVGNLGLGSQGSDQTVAGSDAVAINQPSNFSLRIAPPSVTPNVWVPDHNPVIGIDSADITIRTDASGTVYYFLIPVRGTAGDPTGTDYILVDEPDPQLVGGGKPEWGRIPVVGTSGTSSATAMRLEKGHPDTLNISAPGEPVHGNSTQWDNTGRSLLGSNLLTVLNLKNLTANTSYILYLVPTGLSNQPADNAVCYRFTTKPPVPPKILIEQTGVTEARLRVDTDCENVKYLLARTWQFEQNPYFSEPFIGDMLKEPVPSNTSSPVRTVLDAMLVNYPGQTEEFKETVFDHCATEETKRIFADRLRALQNEDFIPAAITPDRFTFNLSASGVKTVNVREIDTTSTYTLVAVATSKASGLDGFRASPAFRIELDENLYVRSSYIGINRNTFDPDVKFSGDIVISFTDVMCYHYGSGRDYARVDTCQFDNLHSSADHIDPANGINYPYVVLTTKSMPEIVQLTDKNDDTLSHSNKNIIGEDLRLTLMNATNNFKINFSGQLCSTSGEVKNRSPLTITLKKPTREGGDWTLEITRGWEQTN